MPFVFIPGRYEWISEADYNRHLLLYGYGRVHKKKIEMEFEVPEGCKWRSHVYAKPVEMPIADMYTFTDNSVPCFDMPLWKHYVTISIECHVFEHSRLEEERGDMWYINFAAFLIHHNIDRRCIFCGKMAVPIKFYNLPKEELDAIWSYVESKLKEIIENEIETFKEVM